MFAGGTHHGRKTSSSASHGNSSAGQGSSSSSGHGSSLVDPMSVIRQVYVVARSMVVADRHNAATTYHLDRMITNTVSTYKLTF